MVVHTASESCYPLLIGHGGLSQVHGAAIRERERQTDRGQALIAIEQRPWYTTGAMEEAA